MFQGQTGKIDLYAKYLLQIVTEKYLFYFKVRATPDNIKEIKSSARSVKTDNVANLTAGFEYGFEILHRVRSYQN